MRATTWLATSRWFEMSEPTGSDSLQLADGAPYTVTLDCGHSFTLYAHAGLRPTQVGDYSTCPEHSTVYEYDQRTGDSMLDRDRRVARVSPFAPVCKRGSTPSEDRPACGLKPRYSVTHPSGRHHVSESFACRLHLSGVVDYVTVPGRSVTVTRLADPGVPSPGVRT